ncbi:FAD-dependent monooxygenase [Nocardia asteroides NBRC 15531]|uniref:Oxidoreductase n=1 Tax=Nocardia asteroides NBRC 15531 TaxID=1110697 RepID=U5E4G8_NOCAS|nr:NAD(P)/FAD-dependent oxidoreductase [Nocardia asteroides]TLF62039.1 FAD-dependent monooxygenase [Nocardia asteroides NBRC 15531]UGT47412.1 FAD-dependent monooxygenase [Nocardia asteroides]SFN76449.1 2-polyprenyl-6-methoxyphenol hydroxylase [Nocardia asteroides]VEG33691.1 6-hydroxynicotinate 3-monooxygenase precursor [Nocardia asteroides]GAD81525.1 putative oxidoreductase [Nocardia asteroides NBRC 15531]
MSNTRSALVIGGGIAGPVAATALRLAGVDAHVYEAYSGPSDGIGSGLALAPNGVAALDIIGAGDAVRAIALPVRGMRLAVGGREHVLPVLPDQPPLQVVDRGELHRTLHDHAVGAGVGFRYDKRLTHVDEHADGVTAHFADGSTATADILIGADGIRSTVRGLIDPAAPGPDYTGMLGFGALIDCDQDLPADTMVFAFGAKAYYLYWQHADGRVAWGANLPSAQYYSLTEARAIPAEHWLRVLRETYAPDTPGGEFARRTTAENLEITGALHIMPPVPHWYRDRMVLVGDSVHAPSNSSGQGASLAIESAIQLARCLRDIEAPALAFAAYERLRRARVEGIATRAARVNHSKTPGPVARRFMNALMPLMVRTVMNPEKTMGAERRYRIDWDAPVQRELATVS